MPKMEADRRLKVCFLESPSIMMEIVFDYALHLEEKQP